MLQYVYIMTWLIYDMTLLHWFLKNICLTWYINDKESGWKPFGSENMALKFLDTDADSDMGMNTSARLGVEEGRVPMRRSSSYRGTLL